MARFTRLQMLLSFTMHRYDLKPIIQESIRYGLGQSSKRQSVNPLRWLIYLIDLAVDNLL